jgi:hypothetical protein
MCGFRSTTLSLILLLAASPGARSAPTPLPGCTTAFVPTAPGYDFTADHDRWGQTSPDYGIGDNARVRAIHVTSLPIFNTADPAENNALYRLVNRLKADTKPAVLRHLVLFREGDTVTDDRIAESERLLRAPKYTSDAAIRVVTNCPDGVDLEVIAKEVWTLVPDIKLKTSGGQTESGLGIHDSDFLGTGSTLVLSYAHQVDRDRILAEFSDDNFRGSRITLLGHFEQNSDGYVRTAKVALPFYALDSTRAWGIYGSQSKWTQHQYQSGNEVSGIGKKQDSVELWAGTSEGLVGNATSRFIWGVVADQTRYQVLAIAAPLPLSDDLNLAYPYFEYQYLENRFGVAYNINQIRRSEDIQMGLSLRSRVGLSLIDDTRIVFEGELRDTLMSENKHLLLAGVSWAGRANVAAGETEDTRVSMDLTYHRGQTEHRSLFFSFKYSNAWNMNSEDQLLLGGANGLRGYPSNFATGNSSLLFTAEQRKRSFQTVIDCTYTSLTALVRARTFPSRFVA